MSGERLQQVDGEELEALLREIGQGLLEIGKNPVYRADFERSLREGGCVVKRGVNLYAVLNRLYAQEPVALTTLGHPAWRLDLQPGQEVRNTEVPDYERGDERDGYGPTSTIVDSGYRRGGVKHGGISRRAPGRK